MTSAASDNQPDRIHVSADVNVPARPAKTKWEQFCKFAEKSVIPLLIAITGVATQYFIQQQISGIQAQQQKENLKRDYVQIAAGILKEKPISEQNSIRDWAVDILKDNSPVKLTPDAEKALRTTTTLGTPIAQNVFPPTPIGRGFQLADDITASVLKATLDWPAYPARPKHTAVSGQPAPDVIYKQYAIREYNEDYAKEFHRKFDKRLGVVLGELDTAIAGYSTAPTKTACMSVKSVADARECAAAIVRYASSHSPG